MYLSVSNACFREDLLDFYRLIREISDMAIGSIHSEDGPGREAIYQIKKIKKACHFYSMAWKDSVCFLSF